MDEAKLPCGECVEKFETRYPVVPKGMDHSRCREFCAHGKAGYHIECWPIMQRCTHSDPPSPTPDLTSEQYNELSDLADKFFEKSPTPTLEEELREHNGRSIQNWQVHSRLANSLQKTESLKEILRERDSIHAKHHTQLLPSLQRIQELEVALGKLCDRYQETLENEWSSTDDQDLIIERSRSLLQKHTS